MVSEYYGCSTSRTTIFLKTYGEEMLDAHIRTIVVLTGGKLTRIYFLHLLLYNDAPTIRLAGKYTPVG
jgi:hypothetical protein